MSLRDTIFKSAATREVEAFGETLLVAEIGALDRIAYIEYLQKLQNDGVSDEKAGVLLSAFLAVKCIVGEDGKRIFADDEVDEFAGANIDLAELNKVFRAAAEINKLVATEGN